LGSFQARDFSLKPKASAALGSIQVSDIDGMYEGKFDMIKKRLSIMCNFSLLLSSAALYMLKARDK
jgi:hypothetical protein